MNTVGRLIAVLLFIALLVPGVLLSRAWALAAGRRAVAEAGVEMLEPTAEGMDTLHRQAQHGRRGRRFGFLLGLAAVIGSVVVLGESSVFLWVPALAVGLLGGVLLTEATRPRPRWKVGVPARRPRRTEQVSVWLLWTMRAAAVGEAAVALALWSTGELHPDVARLALGIPVAAWLLAELALLRILVRPLPAAGADVPVDEALRTWTAHLAVAAASVLTLLPLGTLLLVAGVGLGSRISAGLDLRPVALVAAGFAALASGIAVAGFLLTWLRPVRTTARALAG